MAEYTIYIDEAGDLGANRGTQWFVLSGVIVAKTDEAAIRTKIASIRSRLNINEIHFRKITDFLKRAFVVRELSEMPFTYMNILVDTRLFDTTKIPNSLIAYNYVCKYLLQRISWYLSEKGATGDIVLSARGTARDNELISYIKDKLLPYQGNQIDAKRFDKISAKAAATWDMLQLADVCATTMFFTYNENGWGFCTPCYSLVLSKHLYRRNDKVDSYGIKFFQESMRPNKAELQKKRICAQK